MVGLMLTGGPLGGQTIISEPMLRMTRGWPDVEGPRRGAKKNRSEPVLGMTHGWPDVEGPLRGAKKTKQTDVECDLWLV